MLLNYKITVDLSDFSIKEEPITAKHYINGEEDNNYRLIYFSEFDCLYSRGIIIRDGCDVDIKEKERQVRKARKLLADKYKKVIFSATDIDCPEKLIQLASRY